LLTGPFKNLNAEEIDGEVSEMWRTLYKLMKTFSEQPGPRIVCDRTKNKIDKFKVNLPLLHVVCNPGIRDRHWETVSGDTWLCL
jgi:dynein heavy chain